MSGRLGPSSSLAQWHAYYLSYGSYYNIRPALMFVDWYDMKKILIHPRISNKYQDFISYKLRLFLYLLQELELVNEPAGIQLPFEASLQLIGRCNEQQHNRKNVSSCSDRLLFQSTAGKALLRLQRYRML